MSEFRAEGVWKRFQAPDGVLEILRGVDLVVPVGDSIAILGVSGSGKSTLLHILGGLERPSDGRVTCDGVDVYALEPDELARFRNEKLGFVFQFHHLLPEFTALENVMMPGLLRGSDEDAVRDAARSILEEVDLGHRLEHPVGKLSGGERQRVAVARALVLNPALVLADEPTGNLDPGTGERVGDLLLGLNRARSTALVIVTHNEALAARMERALVLDDGRLRPA